MSWSDAARAAAAEARRLHSSAKRDPYMKSDANRLISEASFDRSDSNKLGAKKMAMFHKRQLKKMMGERKGIADKIRAIRSGKFFPAAHERTGLQKQAVLSTTIRNFLKKAK